MDWFKRKECILAPVEILTLAKSPAVTLAPAVGTGSGACQSPAGSMGRRLLFGHTSVSFEMLSKLVAEALDKCKVISTAATEAIHVGKRHKNFLPQDGLSI